MEKVINVKISGSEINQSSAFGGVQHEAEARVLKLFFDDEWSGYSKSVTFFDGEMQNPVKVMLTDINKNEDGTYEIKIPPEPLKTGGKLTYIVEGRSEGVLFKSVSKELKVKYAPDTSGAGEPEELTPSVADQLNLSIETQAQRLNVLEPKIGQNQEEISILKERASKHEDDLTKKADTAYVNEALPKPASKEQASEALDDLTYMTPYKTGEQIKTVLSKTLVNTPEFYTKESVEGMKSISGMKNGDMCIILNSDTNAQSIYRYYTKDIDGDELSNPQWVWVTDLSLFAPQSVQILSTGQWDYTKGNSARLDMTEDTVLSILNVQSGDYGVLDVYGEFELTLPETSYKRPPDWDYLAPLSGQHYRYSFYFDGAKFDWSRSVRENG